MKKGLFLVSIAFIAMLITGYSQAPVAQFIAGTTQAVTGKEITFTDQSINEPTKWEWNFGGNAFPQTSDQPNPKVRWVTPGSYTVSLKVSNAAGNHTETKTGYINITQYTNPAVNPVILGNVTSTLTSCYPISSGARYPLSAALYTADEIGAAGVIESLSWYTQNARGDRPIRLFMKQTTLTELSPLTWAAMVEGATEVFNGTFSNGNNQWAEITLDNPFDYDGTSNLLVMGFVDSNRHNLNANIRYTSSTNRHMEWYGSSQGPSTGMGSVNNNRPNLRIRFRVYTSAPQAVFAGLNSVFSEDFEADVFPPADWNVADVDAEGSQWKASVEFNKTIGGTRSASHLHGLAGAAETGLLISPQLDLAGAGAEYFLTFWSKNEWPAAYGNNAVLISTTNNTPASFTQVLWSPVTVSNEWQKVTINLSAYAGQKVYIAFRYTGTDAHSWFVDDVDLSVLAYNNITVYEGDQVTLINKSTQHPEVFDWRTPGAVDPMHSSRNVSTTYAATGQFDVSLRTGNPMGQSIISRPAFVNVKGRAPIAGIAGTGNLRTITYQPFIPMGGSVDFSDNSSRVPTEWNWWFERGLPGNATQPQVKIVYSNPGLFDVSLDVSNENGNNSILKKDFVKVGGKAHVTNLFPGDELRGYNAATGQIPGHGQFKASGVTYRFYQWAEYFSNRHEIELSSLDVMVRSAAGIGKNITITVWDGSEGVPGAVLAQEVVAISSLLANSKNTIALSETLVITADFFIGFELTYDAAHNYGSHIFSISTAADRGAENASASTAWLKIGSTPANATWRPVNEALAINTSMGIYPLVKYPGEEVMLAISVAGKGDVIAEGLLFEEPIAFLQHSFVELEAKPAMGYEFAGWSGDLVSPQATETILMATEKNITATFNRITYDIITTVAGNGKIEPASGIKVNHGDDATFAIVADEGYHIKDVFVDGIRIGAPSEYTFTAVMKHHTLHAVFEINTYTLTYEPSTGGTLEGELVQQVEHGAAGSQVEAVAAEGFYFAGWSDGLTINPRKELAVTADITVKANFAALGALYVTLVSNPAGAGVLTGGGEYAEGDQVKAQAAPGAGFTFLNWTKNANILTTETEYAFIAVGNETLTANFQIISYKIQYLASENGIIQGVATQTVNYGSSSSQVTAVPSTGYHFAGWSDGFATATRSDVNVTADLTVTADFSINKYSLTYLADAGGSVDGTTPQEVEHGSNGTTVTAIPATGYVFVKWSDGVTTASRTDLTVVKNINVTAAFALKTYSLSYITGSRGSIQGVANQTVSHGASGTQVSAIPNAGYYFIRWSDGNTNPRRTDNNITSDRSFTAEFGVFSYTVTYLADGNGTIQGTAVQSVEHGGNTTMVTAVAATGHYFAGWSDGLMDASRMEEGVTEEMILVAEFLIKTYTLSYTAGANGTLTGNVLQSVIHGLNGTSVSAVPATGYYFTGWSDGSTQNPRTDLNVSANISVTANFSLIGTYYITLIADPSGAGILTGGGQHANGEVITLKAQPNAGYTFKNWSLNATSIATANEFEITVTANRSYTAHFEIASFVLKYQATANGIIQGTTEQTVTYGADGTRVTAVPANGYHFVKWSDGVLTASRTDVNITTDILVDAIFEINTYTLSYLPGANGSIQGAASQVVKHGDNGTTVTAVANTGYHFVKWSDGTTTPSRTDENITTELSFTATFAINSYAVAYEALANGSIQGNTQQMVNHGASATAVTAIPATGYYFVQWSDGVTNATRTDVAVTAPLHITASFAIKTFTVNYLTDGNGTLEGVSQQQIEYGGNSTAVTAVATTGYYFDKWSDGVLTATRAENMIVSDLSVTAVFALTTYTLEYLAAANGALQGAVSQTVGHGQNGTEVTAVAADGYHFVEWNDGLKTASRTDRNVMGAHSFTATFAINVYTLTINMEGTGKVIVNGNPYVSPLTFNHGSDIVIEAISEDNFLFDGWKGDVASEETSISLVMGSDKTITVIFLDGTGISESLSSVRIYPNPFRNQVSLENTTGLRKIIVNSITGNKVFETEVSGEMLMKINTGDFAPGIYFIILESKNGQKEIRKVVKGQ
jgi:uncharacterized repeat protein (TIGR02543 family)